MLMLEWFLPLGLSLQPTELTAICSQNWHSRLCSTGGQDCVLDFVWRLSPPLLLVPLKYLSAVLGRQAGVGWLEQAHAVIDLAPE